MKEHRVLVNVLYLRPSADPFTSVNADCVLTESKIVLLEENYGATQLNFNQKKSLMSLEYKKHTCNSKSMCERSTGEGGR